MKAKIAAVMLVALLAAGFLTVSAVASPMTKVFLSGTSGDQDGDADDGQVGDVDDDQAGDLDDAAAGDIDDGGTDNVDDGVTGDIEDGQMGESVEDPGTM